MGNVFGDLFGAGIQGNYDQQAANQALTGFNYLSGNPAEQGYINNGGAANSQIAALLGVGSPGAVNGAQNAFKNYLGSTGYNFNLQQGQNAINGNMAAKGLLNSGATGKALTSYGQGLASNYFNNYIGQLSGLAGAGQTALGQVGAAGTQGGGNAAGYTQGIGQAWSQGVNNALGGLGGDIFGLGGII